MAFTVLRGVPVWLWCLGCRASWVMWGHRLAQMGVVRVVAVAPMCVTRLPSCLQLPAGLLKTIAPCAHRAAAACISLCVHCLCRVALLDGLGARDLPRAAMAHAMVTAACCAGDGISTIRSDIIIALGTPVQRREFLEYLAKAPGTPTTDADGCQADEPPRMNWRVRTTWSDALPPVRWFRFDVVKVREALVAVVCPTTVTRRTLIVDGGSRGRCGGWSCLRASLSYRAPHSAHRFLGASVVKRIVREWCCCDR